MITRLRLAGPLVMVVAGIVVTSFLHEDLTELLYASTTEHTVELILALLLFIDATEVRGGLFGGETPIAARLLCIALPLSLIAATGLGVFLLPHTTTAVLVVVACVVVPTDLAPAASLVHDRRLPARVRRILNVESGYNDGIVAPVFVVALALLGDDGEHDSVMATILHATQSSIVAIVVGGIVGYGGGRVIRAVTARALTTAPGVRVSVVLLVFLAYGGAVTLSANGFIAAFVCGMGFHAARTANSTLDRSELTSTEDLGALSSMAMWYLFGATLTYLAGFGLPDWEVFVYVAAALTVVRMLPIGAALIGSNLPSRDRWAVALLGPRGTASIVFGLLAWRAITDIDDASLVLYVMTATVAGSIAFHGFVTESTSRRYNRDTDRSTDDPTARRTSTLRSRTPRR
ncbi:cation:proton antiporter domain-containing protein [Rhodococcus yananensis]|uniref:cation:proton antiporter domain-containing protein n=1 Tax=Rhodococcus yananensis TaxID=2879464 RepID=UPI003557ECD1